MSFRTSFTVIWPQPQGWPVSVVFAVSVRWWEWARSPPGIPASQELRTLCHILWRSGCPVPSKVRPGGRCKSPKPFVSSYKVIPKNAEILAVKKPSNSEWGPGNDSWFSLASASISVYMILVILVWFTQVSDWEKEWCGFKYPDSWSWLSSGKWLLETGESVI